MTSCKRNCKKGLYIYTHHKSERADGTQPQW